VGIDGEKCPKSLMAIPSICANPAKRTKKIRTFSADWILQLYRTIQDPEKCPGMDAAAQLDQIKTGSRFGDAPQTVVLLARMGSLHRICITKEFSAGFEAWGRRPSAEDPTLVKKHFHCRDGCGKRDTAGKKRCVMCAEVGARTRAKVFQ
jgi:hypothetical protein